MILTYHLVDTIAYLAASAVPVYFLIRSKNGINNPMKNLMVILTGFLFAQAAYHAASLSGFGLMSKITLEPLSAVLLVATAVVYLLTRKKVQKEVKSSLG